MLVSRRIILPCLLVVSLLLLFIHYTPRSRTVPEYAFATFLGNFTTRGDKNRHAHIPQLDGDAAQSIDPDGYYLGARYLNYMLKHHPKTRSRSRKPFPLLVLATEDVEEYKIARLQQEDAYVVRTEKISPPHWLKPGDLRYSDVLTKLRLWQLTAFTKICFIDADVMIAAPIDGVFYDPATEVRVTLPMQENEQSSTQQGLTTELPESYVFAAHSENFHFEHPLPPLSNESYLNSGFFVLAPNQKQYEYYLSRIQDSAMKDWKGGAFPEQDLFNDAHGWSGPMPWQQLHWQWNANYPTMRDLKAGVKSLHDKFWEDEQSDPDFRSDKELKALWIEQIREMEKFYRKKGV